MLILSYILIYVNIGSTMRSCLPINCLSKTQSLDKEFDLLALTCDQLPQSLDKEFDLLALTCDQLPFFDESIQWVLYGSYVYSYIVEVGLVVSIFWFHL